MTIAIRTAQMHHAADIAKIIQMAFDEPSDVVRIRARIGSGKHLTFVATQRERVVGFVDGFLTTSQAGIRRLELDLLAMHPDFARQGIGKRLIVHFTEKGLERHANIALIRALVRVDNVPMQFALRKCAYHRGGSVHALYLFGTEPRANVAQTHQTHAIPVNTMTYRGVWIEGRISIGGIQAVNAMYHNTYTIMGAVVPEHDQATREVLEAHGASLVNKYEWWTCSVDPYSGFC